MSVRNSRHGYLLKPYFRKDSVLALQFISMPHPRAKAKPQQDSRRGKIAFRTNSIPARDVWRAKNKPCVHQDPETPQRLGQNCVWVSPVKAWISSGLLQGQMLWVQQIWVWHKPSQSKSPLTPTVVMYGCESWSTKKAEGQRIDAFELWCWRVS